MRLRIRRVKPQREGSAALALGALPLDVSIGKRTLGVASRSSDLDVEISVRLYAFGAAAVIAELSIPEGMPI